MYRCARLLCLCLSTFALYSAKADEGNVPPPPKNGINREALQRVKEMSPPLKTASGTIYVRSLSSDRATLRRPIATFAERVETQLKKTFLPVGSDTFPLLIEIGTQTNAVTTLERKRNVLDKDFSQLVIHIPNPDTVDLVLLREAIGEALLREKVREHSGHYTDYSWERWWLNGVLDAARGSAWRAEAYDRLWTAFENRPLPTLKEILTGETPPSRETAAFFANWLFTQTPFKNADRRLDLLLRPWSPETLLKTLDNDAWVTWLAEQDNVIFVPGVISHAQFLRWKARLVTPRHQKDAMRLTRFISRSMIGRPKAFCDLAEAYLDAYTSYLIKGIAAYQTKRNKAEALAAELEAQLTRDGRLETQPEP